MGKEQTANGKRQSKRINGLSQRKAKKNKVAMKENLRSKVSKRKEKLGAIERRRQL